MTTCPRHRRCAKPEASPAVEGLEERFLLAGDAAITSALAFPAGAAPARGADVVPVEANTPPVAGDDVFATWIERVSLRFNQRQINDYSYGGAASADGRYVAFESWSPLVPDDANMTLDVFVLDRLTGTLERISVSSSGEEAAGGSYGPSISADGRYVCFVSEAPNLVADDTNGMDDVFVHDRLTGQTVRASVSSAGVEGNGMNTGAAISADGRFVSFTSTSTNLVSGDTNAKDDVFVRDLQAGTTERVSVSSAGAEGNNPSVANAVSGDGRYVVFQSTASNLVSGDTNGVSDIFVRDRHAGTTVRVSVSAAGAQGNDASYSPAISANGRYVAFESWSTNLVPGDTNATRDIFVRDLQTGAMQRASVSTAGTQGDGPSSLPSLSPDGRYVTFASNATNLVAGDANAAADVFVRDTLAGSTSLLSASVAGVEGNADSGPRLCMALTGDYMVFKSSASNLVPKDTNNVIDAFLVRLAPGATDEDTPLRITADLLLANDTDADANRLTISNVIATSEHGASVTLNEDGSVTYDPTASEDLNDLAVGETLQDTFTYTVSDGMGGSDTATVTLTVAGANDAPVVDDDAFGVDENSANGTAVGAVTAADPDVGDSLTYALTDGNVGGAFAVNPATGRITVADGSKLNYEASASYSLTVTVTDSHGASDTATITVDLNDVNEAPVADNATFAIDENSADGAFVGAVTAVDPDAGDSLSYEITAGNDDGVFAIDEATGEITVADGAQLDFEARPSYVLTILVTDSGANTDTASVTVNVHNANEAPVAESDTFAVDERAANGTVVGVVTAVDPDAGDTLHYAITEGNDDGVFAINALTGRITVADGAKLNYQDLAGYDLAVTVTDSHGASDTAVISVDVNDLNDPPVAENDAFSVDENSGNGDYVGVVTASDPDGGDSLSYAITGGNVGGAFAIDAQTGEITVADPTQLNFEARASYTLTVRVTDSAANSATATITVGVNDVNEAPVAQDGAFSVNEGADNGTVVGTVTASDPDAGDALSYEITAGDDDGAFAIDGETGQITVTDGTMLHFDAADSYTLTVMVTDMAANTATAAITVNINNVNEPPAADDDTFAVDENADNGTYVGTVNATDSDADDTLSYAIPAGNVGGAFVIDSETGEISVADGTKLNYEARASYTLTVLVTDSADGAATATITVDVNNVNEAPVNTVPGAQWAALNGELVFSAGGHNGISIADVDAGQNELAVTLSVEHGTLTLASTDGLSVIDGADGTECVTFTGSLADINAALEGLTYAPEADYSGDDTLTIVTDDQGHTGSGDAQSDTSTVDLVVNTPPTIASLDTEETVMRSRPLTLTAAADDSDGTVASVSFYRDVDQNGLYDEGADELLGVDANGANGWSWTGLTVDWPVGDQFFLAVAKDNQGAASEAAATSTTVTPYSLTWSNSTATVTVMDLVGGIDISRANIAVSFTGARVNAITLKGVQPMEGLAIVIQGASSVGSIVDARRGVLGEVAFIASDSPVSNISIKGAVTGWNLNAQSFGGIDFSEDVDGDGGSDDLTGLFLGAGGVLRARKLGLTANVAGAVSVGSIRADVVAQSGLKSFRAVAGASDMDIVIASATGTASVSLGSAGNVNLSSEMNLTKLEAGRWAGGQITAPVINTLKIAGLLTADIVLTAEAATTAMATMTVGGTMLDASLRSRGKVKSITVGGMTGSSILVGVNDEVTGLPQDRTDFADIADATLPGIASFTVRSGAGGVRFAHSNVAAWTIGMISLANVQKDTQGEETTFGIATSSLKSYKRTEGLVTAYKWPNRASAWPMDDAADFVVSGLSA